MAGLEISDITTTSTRSKQPSGMERTTRACGTMEPSVGDEDARDAGPWIAETAGRRPVGTSAVETVHVRDRRHAN